MSMKNGLALLSVFALLVPIVARRMPDNLVSDRLFLFRDFHDLFVVVVSRVHDPEESRNDRARRIGDTAAALYQTLYPYHLGTPKSLILRID